MEEKQRAFKKVSKGIQVTKCNPEFIEKMVKILRLGAYVETAAIMAGCAKETFLDWMKWSHQEHKKYKPIYAQLRHAVEKAIEEATVRDLMVIDKCANGQDYEYERWQEGERDKDGILQKAGALKLNSRGNPIPIKVGFAPNYQAAAWRLSRRKPEQWGDSQTIEHKGDGLKTEKPQVIICLPDNGRSIQRLNDLKDDSNK